MRLLLINPNTSQATTQAMVGIARESAPSVEIDGLSAPFGVPLITGPAELAIGRDAVVTLMAARPPFGYQGVIVAAFGDPALDELRRTVAVPVTGIAEAGMAEAAHHGRFAVVTTTPDLTESIAARADAYGHGDSFLGTVLTAVRQLGARAIVIGGGPLAVAAREIANQLPVPVIEPVPAAVRLAIRRAERTAQEM
ncbi:MAG: hyuE [Xanthobacteraceae bacterium]|nr:MAG: hyuE [Xanthobacteraceae bacterium]